MFVPSTDEGEEGGGAVTAEEGGDVNEDAILRETDGRDVEEMKSSRKRRVDAVTDANSPEIEGVAGIKSAKNKSGKREVIVTSASSKGKRSSDKSAELSGAESTQLSDAESAELESVADESSSTDSSSEDEDFFLGGSEGRFGEEEEEAVEVWGEEAPLSEDTSRRLALCNMDWDHVGAKDVFG